MKYLQAGLSTDESGFCDTLWKGLVTLFRKRYRDKSAEGWIEKGEDTSRTFDTMSTTGALPKPALAYPRLFPISILRLDYAITG